MSYVLGAAGPEEMFVRGDGAWVWDRGGRKFLDGRSGIANLVLGYGRKDIADAMHRQALELPFVCTLRYERPAEVTVEYARALVEVAPAGLTHVRFTHTGSSAVEAAVLMARRYHRNLGRAERLWTIGLQGAFHGTTLTTMAAAGQPNLHAMYGPMPEGFRHVPPPTPDDPAAGFEALRTTIEELGVDRTTAVIVEPVKGLAGIPLPAEYLRSVRDFCTRHDILLIFDEVFSGLGRMGPMFAAALSGVEPDILCLSKTMTAGYAALGGVLASEKVYDAFDLPGQPYFLHGSSTDAHPISCAAGLATLTALEAENALKSGTQVGCRIRDGLAEKLADAPFVTGVRSLGCYVAIDPRAPEDFLKRMEMMRHIQAGCERRGVLIDYTPEIIMIVPPYTLPDADADLIVDVVAEVLATFDPASVDPASLRPPSPSGRR